MKRHTRLREEVRAAETPRISPTWLNGKGILIAAALLIGGGAAGCGSSNALRNDQSNQQLEVTPKADPFAVLDEQAKTGSIDPRLVEERLDAARQQWLRALAAQQRTDKTAVVRHFEAAIDILDRLIYYPGVTENKSFQAITASVIEDYDKFVARIDELPENASIFALQRKFELEMEKLKPVEITPKFDLTSTTIELTDNTPVRQTISYFTEGGGRAHMAKWLARSGKYFPMMRKVMKEEGLPEEIIHLSMIESGLSPTAMSWAKAVGLWQFIGSTGAMYGLSSNWWLDKRRDPETATRAAARHLRDLYQSLGDWHLALAAYNSGINRVRGAIAQSGSRNFWEIKPYLPRETQNYVPLFIAATTIAMDPTSYGFSGVVHEKPLAYETVPVFEAIDFKALSKAAGISELELKELNPELLQTSTPPVEVSGANGYALKVPVGASERFAERLAQIPESEKRAWLVHNVRRGETLKSIARTYGLTVDQLAEYNNLSQKSSVKSGGRLRVPMAVMAPQTGKTEIASASTTSETSSKTIRHKVKRGETARSIASRYGVRTQDLPKKLKAGQTLSIKVPVMAANEPQKASSVTAPSEEKKEAPDSRKWISYKVKRGETLGKIADAFSVGLKDLRSWNGNLKSVKSGQTLKINASNEDAAAVAESAAETSSSPKQHIVRSGETYFSIGRKYGVTASQVQGWNTNVKTSELQVGQTLKIYAGNATASLGDRVEKAAKTKATKVVYRVKRGDTLHSIASKYDVSVDDLKAANGLRSSAISVGKRLTIPAN